MSEGSVSIIETARQGLEDGLLYVAEHVNLEKDQEDRLVDLLRYAQELGNDGLDLLGRVIEAVMKRTAGDEV